MVNRKEWIRNKKESMSPFRWKVMTVGLPLYIVLSLLLIAVFVRQASAEKVEAVAVIVWLACLVFVNIGMAFLSMRLTKEDGKFEMQRFSYLFEKELLFEEEQLIVADEELAYTLEKEGVKLEFPDEGAGQVFDEARENVFFIPWERAELALASQSVRRHVYLAVAVFSMDEDMVPFFIPLDEKVCAFMKKNGLDKKMDGNWTYLTYNPEDAFKQLVTKGRITKMYNKKTGKMFVNEAGEFLDNE